MSIYARTPRALPAPKGPRLVTPDAPKPVTAAQQPPAPGSTITGVAGPAPAVPPEVQVELNRLRAQNQRLLVGQNESKAALFGDGTVTPNIVTGNGVTPQLSTASTITMD